MWYSITNIASIVTSVDTIVNLHRYQHTPSLPIGSPPPLDPHSHTSPPTPIPLHHPSLPLKRMGLRGTLSIPAAPTLLRTKFHGLLLPCPSLGLVIGQRVYCGISTNLLIPFPLRLLPGTVALERGGLPLRPLSQCNQ